MKHSQSDRQTDSEIDRQTDRNVKVLIKGGGEKQWEVEKEKDIQIQIVIHETARVPIGYDGRILLRALCRQTLL